MTREEYIITGKSSGRTRDGDRKSNHKKEQQWMEVQKDEKGGRAEEKKTIYALFPLISVCFLMVSFLTYLPPFIFV